MNIHLRREKAQRPAAVPEIDKQFLDRFLRVATAHGFTKADAMRHEINRQMNWSRPSQALQEMFREASSLIPRAVAAEIIDDELRAHAAAQEAVEAAA